LDDDELDDLRRWHGMSFMWLAVWLIKRRPRVRMFRGWNDWAIALGVCLALDVLSSVGRASGVRRRVAAKKVTIPSEPKPVAVSVS
jgi:hypothetical protein